MTQTLVERTGALHEEIHPKIKKSTTGYIIADYNLKSNEYGEDTAKVICTNK